MLHYHRENGFVIIIVLIFMQIFIALSWYSLESILLVTRFTKNISSRHFLQEQGLRMMSEIEPSVGLQLPWCQIPYTESSLLVQKPIRWWQSQTCAGNFQRFKYYYVVEPLVIDSCAMVEQTKLSAEYVRITLLMLTNSNAEIFMQSVIVRSVADRLLSPCQGVKHIVQLGRQSWRELEI